MRSILFVAGTAGLIGLISACGGDSRPNAIADGGTSSGGKGGKGGKGGTDNEGGENLGGAGNEADPLAPVVTIVSPVAVDDPNEGPVVSGDLVRVTCDVRSSTKS